MPKKLKTVLTIAGSVLAVFALTIVTVLCRRNTDRRRSTGTDELNQRISDGIESSQERADRISDGIRESEERLAGVEDKLRRAEEILRTAVRRSRQTTENADSHNSCNE